MSIYRCAHSRLNRRGTNSLKEQMKKSEVNLDDRVTNKCEQMKEKNTELEERGSREQLG